MSIVSTFIKLCGILCCDEWQKLNMRNPMCFTSFFLSIMMIFVTSPKICRPWFHIFPLARYFICYVLFCWRSKYINWINICIWLMLPSVSDFLKYFIWGLAIRLPYLLIWWPIFASIHVNLIHYLIRYFEFLQLWVMVIKKK